MGLDYDELFPGRFLKNVQFKGRDVTLTITGIRLEELPEEKGGMRTRGIVSFKETELALVLNRTNGECLKGMFGRDTGAWLGKRVTLYPTTIEAFRGQKLAIRVRGSPDLERDMHVEIKLPRKKSIHVPMRRTIRAPPRVTASAPPLEPEPGMDEETGEIPFDSNRVEPAPQP